MLGSDPEIVDTDVLIVGGGMAGCGAAYEAAYWSRLQGLRTVLVDKAPIERSGAVAMGLSAINCYLGTRWGENTPEDFVRYVRRDSMGLCREDLVYDIARNVDSTVHMFEEWGLPFFKTPDGRYQRSGRWQVMIHGESYKPIVAEAARSAIGQSNIFERVFISHLLTTAGDPDRIAGALGFSIRTPKAYIFRARAVICAAGGATGLYRPQSSGEGLGRAWCAPWNTGSTYSLMFRAGAEMSQFEHQLVLPRLKDGYGPVGLWFLFLKATLENSYGEAVEQKWGEALKEWDKYSGSRPIPTPLRNHQLLQDVIAGCGPHYLRTDVGLRHVLRNSESDDRLSTHLEAIAWEDFLNMTVPQALLWASHDVDPAREPSEVVLTEPYLMGSHASATGAWVSGPADLAPKEYFWGYNRMTTLRGLFAAGDGASGSPHKFSSGSFTEGRLAAKAAIAYAMDVADRPSVDDAQVNDALNDLSLPRAVWERDADRTTDADLNPAYLLPKNALLRLQKIMDEYGGGRSSRYVTNAHMLTRGLALLSELRADLSKLAAPDLHALLRCREVRDRFLCAEAHLHHMLYRTETRWPGYYYRADHPMLDDVNWQCFVNSRYDVATGQWQLRTRPYIPLVTESV